MKRLYPTETSWEYVEQDLILHLQEIATSCPQFKFMLHGQGLNNESLLLDFDGGHCDMWSILKTSPSEKVHFAKGWMIFFFAFFSIAKECTKIF